MINMTRTRFNLGNLILGVFFVGLSIYYLRQPGKALVLFPILVGVGIIFKGLYELFLSRGPITGQHHSWMLFLGVFDLVIGIASCVSTQFGLALLSYCLAFWIIMTSFTEIKLASFYRELERGYYGFIVVVNILMMICGVILLFYPIISLTMIYIMIITILMTIGIVKIIQAF